VYQDRGPGRIDPRGDSPLNDRVNRMAGIIGCLFGMAGLLGAEPIDTVPAFLDALPLADTEAGVKVTAPFLLNPTTVVPAGAILRFLYVRPAPSHGGDGPFADAAKRAAYSRASSDDPAWTSHQVDGIVRSAHRTVWPNVATFRASLAEISSTDLRVVYLKPGAAEPSDEPLEFLRGFLAAERGDAVTVIAIARSGAAMEAGLRAGDRIEIFNTRQLQGSLTTLIDAYAAARAANHAVVPPPDQLRVRRDGGDALLEITLRPPPSLKGSLLDP
jgi:hypothetical protein